MLKNQIQILFIAILSISILYACNGKKKTVETSTAVKQEVTETKPAKIMNDTAAANADEIYPLIVSFISIGEGTDANAVMTMENMLTKYRSQLGKSIPYIAVPWGREGEVDYLFRLSEMTKEEQSSMAAMMKDSFAGNKLVQISENAKCLHIRR
ncbi:MAG: hypothetical protein IPO27_18825 [Bacteroidetes bacterium]|nr:hypothetical protein [Bacteroidota bacterium]